jgi:large subunit ribosomal protein L17
MKKQIKKKKLGRKASHRKSMMNNLFRSLVEHGKIETTTVKAKALKSFSESMLQKYADRNIDNLRKVKPVLKTDDIIEKFFTLTSNNTSAVRVVRIGFRDGDKAEMSRIEFVHVKPVKNSKKKES